MTTTPAKEKRITGVEAKHISYVEHQGGKPSDALIVKERIHYDDKTTADRLRIYENMQRPYWVTHKGKRKHQQKRDAELIGNLQEYKSTQIDLARNAAKSLGMYDKLARPYLPEIAQSPYLYGTDVTSACILKHMYQQRCPETRSLNKVAATDIETDVVNKTDNILMQATSCKEKVIFYVDRNFLSDIPNAEEEIRKEAFAELGDIFKERGIKDIDIRLVNTPGEIVAGSIAATHEMQPDFLTAWNADFEIKAFIRTLEKEGYNLADVFSDKSVPPEYRIFDYNPGSRYKITASGKKIGKDPADIWNWLRHAASWQMIDSMTVYRALRLAGGKEQSYALDPILEKETKLKKLRFKEAEQYKGLRWHEVMQTRYKIKYCVYNIFDAISLEILDEKTTDLSARISTTSGPSEYRHLNSNPKRLCDAFHFWYLNRENKKVIASSSNQQEHELDKYVVSPTDFIVTLAAFLVAPEGLDCIEEAPGMKTLVWIHVADLDVAATYPNVSQILNISPSTCVFEFSRMEGISEMRRKALGVNLTGGKVNALPILQEYLGAPSLDTLLAAFKEEEKIEA